MAECRSLTYVYLHGTEVENAGLMSLARLPKLSVVIISGGPITKSGVAFLLSRRKLKRLPCYGDDFGDEWWTELEKHIRIVISATETFASVVTCSLSVRGLRRGLELTRSFAATLHGECRR